MTVETAIDGQPHEFDAHFHFTEYGLRPYYGLNSVKNSHDWREHGKPTRTIDALGDQWATALDFDDQPLLPWNDDSYRLETTPLFRLYFVAKDGLYDGERADQSDRIRGGTITVRPRWPDMTKDDGSDVRGYMDLGKPYLDVQVQASNIDPRRYLELARSIFAGYDLNPNYFASPNDTSNINDCALYVRVLRDLSGPIHAADGPIARMHNVLTSDRDGYRKHVEDNTKLPGYYVTTTVTDEQAGDLIRGHQLGKEVKHYYPENPRHFDNSDALYHPKVEVSYQSSRTDQTVYWDDVDDLLRELDEMLLNVLEWSGLSIRAGDQFVDDQYFNADAESQRSRKLVDCPLPEIEDDQEATVINLWRDMTTADADLVNHLLADGGSVSPKDAADETGYSYRTIRECIDRLEGFIRHGYGEIEIESKAMQQQMLKRLRAAESEFKDAIGSAASNLADAAKGRSRSPWSCWKRNYGATVSEPADARKRVTLNYRPDDRDDLRQLLREMKTAYMSTGDRRGVSGIHVEVTMQDGQSQYIENVEAFTNPGRNIGALSTAVLREEQKWEEATEDFDWEAWREAGSPPKDRWERIKSEFVGD